MAYSTLADLQKAIPSDNIKQLTDDDNTGSIDQTKVDEAIAWADDLIDSFLRQKYTVPINPVPVIIKQLSIDLAIYYLYIRRFETDIPDGIDSRYSKALKILDRLQSGKMDLNFDIGTGTGSGSEYRINKTSNDRIFTKIKLNQF